MHTVPGGAHAGSGPGELEAVGDGRKVWGHGQPRSQFPELVKQEEGSRESEFGGDNERNFLLSEAYGGAAHPFLTPPVLASAVCMFSRTQCPLLVSDLPGRPKARSWLFTSFLSTLSTGNRTEGGVAGPTQIQGRALPHPPSPGQGSDQPLYPREGRGPAPACAALTNSLPISGREANSVLNTNLFVIVVL